MKFSFTYKYQTEPMQVECELRRNGNVDIVSLTWRGVNVYALLEDFDQIEDIEAEAQRQSEKYIPLEAD
jgi:hypothetical protein